MSPGFMSRLRRGGEEGKRRMGGKKRRKEGKKKEREKREGRDSHVERTRKRIANGGKGATEEDRRWRRKVGDL